MKVVHAIVVARRQSIFYEYLIHFLTLTFAARDMIWLCCWALHFAAVSESKRELISAVPRQPTISRSSYVEQWVRCYSSTSRTNKNKTRQQHRQQPKNREGTKKWWEKHFSVISSTLSSSQHTVHASIFISEEILLPLLPATTNVLHLLIPSFYGSNKTPNGFLFRSIFSSFFLIFIFFIFRLLLSCGWFVAVVVAGRVCVCVFRCISNLYNCTSGMCEKHCDEITAHNVVARRRSSRSRKTKNAKCIWTATTTTRWTESKS